MIKARPISIEHRHLRKAVRARKPIPAQTALILLRDKLEEKLSATIMMDDFADRVLENEAELLHITEDNDGSIWLSVVDHRLLDIALNELDVNEEERRGWQSWKKFGSLHRR